MNMLYLHTFVYISMYMYTYTHNYKYIYVYEREISEEDKVYANVKRKMLIVLFIHAYVSTYAFIKIHNNH
jgi:uncharacterized membrane protein SpoIIM required for sporulation